jgi:hypothetical protein
MAPAMIGNFRRFEAGPDPFGRTWAVEFKWLQNAISIRHSDSVDCKFLLASPDEAMEKVVALMHTDLLALSKKHDRSLTDPWCMKLAGLHVKRLIEDWEDMDRTLVTACYDDLEQYQRMLETEYRDAPVS